MSQLTKFASLVVLSTALSAAGCMAETTASDDMRTPVDETQQASQTEEMDSADQALSAEPAMDVSSEDASAADPGSANPGSANPGSANPGSTGPGSTGPGEEESAGASPDASRFWGWGGGWGFHRPWGFRPWGFRPWGFRPWGWGGFGFRPWGWGGFGFRPWGWGGGCGGWSGCGW
ncbi:MULTISPECIES: hypothetical protein [Sorangium]|uniref:hypothetical protein n=1 Tax=Sorangium TaxID=39643 RepID=UPI003D9C5255